METVDGKTTLTVGGGSGGGYGDYASRPESASKGASYFASDSPIGHWVGDGSAWRPIVGGVVGVEVPTLADFEGDWARYNDAVSLDVLGQNGALLVKGNNDAATRSRGWALPMSSDTAYIEIAFSDQTLITRGSDTYTLFGIGMREAGTAKAVTLQLARTVSGAGVLDHSVHNSLWTNDTTRASFAERLFGIQNDSGAPTFLRVRRTVSDVICEVSRDRTTWTNVATYSIAASFTVEPDQLIIATDCISVSTNGAFQVLHLAVSP